MAKTHDLQSVEIGVESTWGTTVAPTALVPGIQEFSIQPEVTVQEFPSLQGLAPNYDIAVTNTMATATATSLVDYNTLHYWFNSLMKTVAAAGAGPYTWTYAPDLTSQPTRSFYTLVYGDSASAYNISGALVNSLTISGSSGEALSMDIEFVGQFAEADAVAGASATSATSIATAAQAAISIDVEGTYNSTSIGCTAYSFELELNSNTSMVQGLGQIYPCDYFSTRWSATLSMTLEFPGGSNVAKGLLDAMDGQAPATVKRGIGIVCSDGTNDFTLRFAGALMSAPEVWGDENGVTTLEFEWAGIYEGTTLSNFFDIIVTNQSNAVI